MTSYSYCKKCGVQILERTALAHSGQCVPCSRRKWKTTENALILFSILFSVLMLPYSVLRSLWIRRWRSWQFPFSFSKNDQLIREMYPNPGHARSYKRGVIDGYFRPMFGMSTSCPWGQPRIEDIRDGSTLSRSEIEFESLPTRTFAFEPEKWEKDWSSGRVPAPSGDSPD